MGKILNVAIVILILAALVYGYMSFTSTPEDPEGITSEVTGDGSSPVLEQQDEFVALLIDLQNISLNTDFLASTVFTSLKDFTRTIAPQDVGRRNPFAPIGSNAGAASQRSSVISAFRAPTPPPSPSSVPTPAAPAPDTTPSDTPPPDNTTPPPPPAADETPPDDTLPPPDEPFLDEGGT